MRATGTSPAGGEVYLKDQTLCSCRSSLHCLVAVSSQGSYLTSLSLSFFIKFKLASASQRYCGHLTPATIRVVDRVSLRGS